MKYFLTGATGFIGGRVTQQLIAARHEVVTLVRSLDKAGVLKTIGVTLAKGDITDKGNLRAAMPGVEGVFHMATWYKVGA